MEQCCDCEVLTDRTPVSVLAVPKSAIVETNDKKKIVFVQNGTAFQSTDVTLGRESGEFVEVINGLFDGDSLVPLPIESAVNCKDGYILPQ